MIIIIGTILLMIPFSANNGQYTPFLDAMFTAASATCVTGLVRYDTVTHWSTFGQLVILTLIQIGGIGFMTIAISLVSLTRRKIGINKRYMMQQSVSAPHIGGIVRMTKFILFGTVFIEGAGMVLLSFFFCPRYGFWKGLYYSFFHSISAFCNAGFDLMGNAGQFSSLTSVGTSYYLNIIIMVLIIIGGLGFFVWSDIIENRFRFRRFKLHTKVVLSVTILLSFLGTIAILLFEQKGFAFDGISIPQQILASAFQAVSPRTAGFNTIDLTALTESSQFLIICFMLIGGSPGSTAGGIKTTTFAVLVLSVFTTFHQRKAIECFHRRIDDESLRSASCVMMLYLLLTTLSSLIISSIEGLPIRVALFETASAIGTVGLTLGVTPTLGVISEIILIVLMVFGRVGSLTILLAFASNHPVPVSQLPHEKIQIG